MLSFLHVEDVHVGLREVGIRLWVPLQCLRKELMNPAPHPDPTPVARFTLMPATSGSVFLGKFWNMFRNVEVLRHLYRSTLARHLRVFHFKEL